MIDIFTAYGVSSPFGLPEKAHTPGESSLWGKTS